MSDSLLPLVFITSISVRYILLYRRENVIHLYNILFNEEIACLCNTYNSRVNIYFKKGQKTKNWKLREAARVETSFCNYLLKYYLR